MKTKINKKKERQWEYPMLATLNVDAGQRINAPNKLVLMLISKNDAIIVHAEAKGYIGELISNYNHDHLKPLPGELVLTGE